MKKINNLGASFYTKHFKIILLMALAFGIITPASAQFNLKKLGSKALESVESEAKKKLQSTEEEAKKKLKSTAEETVAIKPQYDDIDSVLKVSIKELHAAYLKLDGDVYYNSYGFYPDFLYGGADKSLIPQTSYRILLMKAMAAGQDAPPILVETSKKNIAITAELIINHCFAAFSIYPKDMYYLFIEGRMWLNAMANKSINYNYKDINSLVAFVDGNELKIKGSEYRKYGYAFADELVMGKSGEKLDNDLRIKRWKGEEERLMKLYAKNVDFQIVKNSFINLMLGTVKSSKEKDWDNGVMQSHILDIVAYDMKNHPNKVEDQDYKDAMASYERLAQNNFPKWRAYVKEEALKWFDEYKIVDKLAKAPEAKMKNPALEADFIKIASKIYSDGRVPVKAIIMYPEWSYTKNALGAIIDRYLTAMIIFKEKDGSHRMVDISIKQVYDGKNYGASQHRGIGLTNSKVDYK